MDGAATLRTCSGASSGWKVPVAGIVSTRIVAVDGIEDAAARAQLAQCKNHRHLELTRAGHPWVAHRTRSRGPVSAAR